MAKLFEEVLSVSSNNCSADLFIYFACHQDGSPAGASGHSPATGPVASAAVVASCSTRSPTPAGRGRGNSRGASPVSPRTAGSALRRQGSSASSPIRVAAQDHAPFGGQHAPLRCHTLVLRTQPQLLQRLQAHAARGSTSAWDASDAEAQRQTSSEAAGQRQTSSDAAGAARMDASSVATTASRPDCGSAGGSDAMDELPPACDVVGDPVDHINGGSCGPGSCNTGASGDSHGATLNSPSNRCPGTPSERRSPSKRSVEVTVDDEPEVFFQVIKFVYLNTCHVDHSNVKSLMLTADKYGVEDIVRHCLQWMHEHFTAALFYKFLTFKLVSARHRLLLRDSLLRALRSRQNFSLVTEDADAKWEHLPVCFVEALLGSDELPVVSELEVLGLLTRWASGSLSRQQQASAQDVCGAPDVLSASDDDHGVSDGDSSTTSGRKRLGSISSVGDSSSIVRAQEDMMRLLRTFRKCDMVIKISDLEPILEILQLNSFFSTKPPRETSALDPGFTLYRGVAGTQVIPFGEVNQASVVKETWRGSTVSLGSRDFLQQQDGFSPKSVPAGGVLSFPRLWVRIKCSSWAHREKRTSKSTPSHPRHSIAGSLGGDMNPSISESAAFPLSMSPVNEVPVAQRFREQDDWETGRKLSVRSTGAVPNLTDNEKIDHKVICAVISGHLRHGIRIGQRERTSIYDIAELYGQCDEVCLGGTEKEVEFELQLTVEAPNVCGICRCALAVLPVGAPERPGDPLLEIGFDSSVEENLHFCISSAYFDSNSSYSVGLNWVLRPGALA